MKEATQWDESDLLAMITNHREEDAQLDFKRAESLENTERRKDEISKDVSAFANSAGGVILYGMEENSKALHEARALSPVDPQKTSKDWLEQVINSRIKPRLQGVHIHPVELKKSCRGKFAYVVWVPEGGTAYQAADKKYYKRFNFQSVPMEDYEVRRVMNRSAGPFYNLTLEVGQQNSTPQATEFRFRCFVRNQSAVVGRDVSAVVFVHEDLVRQPDSFRARIEDLPYARISGTYTEGSRSTRSGVEAAHPFSTYAIEFAKSVGIPRDILPQRTKVFVSVFDHLGLALRASYYLHVQDLRLEELDQVPSGRRIPLAVSDELGVLHTET